MRAVRAIGAVGLATLLLWLWQSPTAQQRRLSALRALVASPAWPQLQPTDSQALRDIVSDAVIAAGLSDPVDINGFSDVDAVNPGSTARLHVFVTAPEHAWLTHCQAGNALYDPELDSIFIDGSLFGGGDLTTFGRGWFAERLWGRTEAFAFSRTFTTFVLLHELGHRQLRHAQRSPIGAASTQEPSAAETSADDFALKALTAAYEDGRLKLPEPVANEILEAGIDGNLTTGQQFLASLLYATSQMSVGLLFSRGEFSSLYSDASHPSFGERVRRLGVATAALARRDAGLNRYLAYFRAVSDKVDGLRKLGLLEVDSEQPIEAVAFDEDGLVVVDRRHSIWRTDYAAIADGWKAEPRRMSLRRTSSLPVESGESGPILNAVWSARRGGVFLMFSDGALYQVRAAEVRARPDLVTALGLDAGTRAVRTVGPMPHAVLEVDDGYVVIDGDQAAGHIRRADVLAAAKASGHVAQPTVRSAMVTQAGLRLAINEQAGTLAGTLLITLDRPFRTVFSKLQLSGDVDGYGQLATLEGEGESRHFLVGKVNLEAPINVWELFQTAPPIARAKYDPLLRTLTDLPFTGQNVPVVVTSVQTSGDRSVFATLAGDSLIRFDAQRSVIEPVFHPGVSVQMAMTDTGLVSFHVLNGFKLFILFEQTTPFRHLAATR